MHYALISKEESNQNVASCTPTWFGTAQLGGLSPGVFSCWDKALATLSRGVPGTITCQVCSVSIWWVLDSSLVNAGACFTVGSFAGVATWDPEKTATDSLLILCQYRRMMVSREL